MDSSNVSEDGASERVRFDNTIYYSVNSKDSIEKVCKLCTIVILARHPLASISRQLL